LPENCRKSPTTRFAAVAADIKETS
jgi:hypothetical protein